MNPASINQQLEQANQTYVSVRQLQQTLQAIEAATAETARLEKDIDEQEKNLASLHEEARKTEEALRSAKEKDEKANNLLHTMRTSLEEHLVTLRKRLITEQADICPLCGQHIGHIHPDEDFKTVLTPLEKEKAATGEAWNRANKVNEEAKRRLIRNLPDTKKTTCRTAKENSHGERKRPAHSPAIRHEPGITHDATSRDDYQKHRRNHPTTQGKTAGSRRVATPHPSLTGREKTAGRNQNHSRPDQSASRQSTGRTHTTAASAE